MVKSINFLLFVQKVSSGSGALHYVTIFKGLVAQEPPPPPKKKNGGQRGSKGGPNLAFFIIYFHYLLIYL